MKDTELYAHPLSLIPLYFLRKLNVIHSCIEGFDRSINRFQYCQFLYIYILNIKGGGCFKRLIVHMNESDMHMLNILATHQYLTVKVKVRSKSTLKKKNKGEGCI